MKSGQSLYVLRSISTRRLCAGLHMKEGRVRMLTRADRRAGANTSASTQAGPYNKGPTRDRLLIQAILDQCFSQTIAPTSCWLQRGFSFAPETRSGAQSADSDAGAVRLAAAALSEPHAWAVRAMAGEGPARCDRVRDPPGRFAELRFVSARRAQDRRVRWWCGTRPRWRAGPRLHSICRAGGTGGFTDAMMQGRRPQSRVVGARCSGNGQGSPRKAGALIATRDAGSEGATQRHLDADALPL